MAQGNVIKYDDKMWIVQEVFESFIIVISVDEPRRNRPIYREFYKNIKVVS